MADPRDRHSFGVRTITSAFASLAADVDEALARLMPRPTTDEAMYPAVYDVVATDWGTAPALVHMAYEAAHVPGRLAYLAHLGLEERNVTLLELGEEYCRRLLLQPRGRLEPTA